MNQIRERMEAMCEKFWEFTDAGDRQSARACLAEARILGMSLEKFAVALALAKPVVVGGK